VEQTVPALALALALMDYAALALMDYAALALMDYAALALMDYAALALMDYAAPGSERVDGRKTQTEADAAAVEDGAGEAQLAVQPFEVGLPATGLEPRFAANDDASAVER
jgi:hypothetical protein